MRTCFSNAEEPVHTSPVLAPRPPRRYRFANVEVDFGAAELRRGGLRIKIQDQPLHVLAALLSRRGEVISRDELRKMLWPADTFVDFDHSLNSAIKRLRDVLQDDPDHPHLIETIPRHGYRLIAAVREIEPAEPDRTVSAIEPAEPLSARPATPQQVGRMDHPSRRGSGYSWVIALIILLVIPAILAGLYTSRTRTRSVPVPPQATLAILPFQDLSGKALGHPVAEGMTEELITELAKADPERLALVVQGSSEQALPAGAPTQANHDNKPDYLLKGSIRVQATDARVAVQLIRVKDQQILWTEAYDKPVDDVFQMQRQIAQAVTRAVCDRLNLRRPPNE